MVFVSIYTFELQPQQHWTQLLRSNRAVVLAAYLGDLAHKRDVVTLFADVTDNVTWRFANRAQAKYLRDFRPDLIPPPAQPGQPPSDHTLGTVFELHYFHDPLFVADYLSRVYELEVI